MKITLNDYEINITAKDTICNEKANKHDTLCFLNWLSIALNSAAKYENQMTCHAIAKEMKKAAEELFTICKENGLYKNNERK